MYRHIVMFQLRKDIDEAARQTVFEEFKNGIEALPPHIPCIRHVEVRKNVNPQECWDVCLVSEFQTLEEIGEYSRHPLHQAVAGKLKPWTTGRACVDYEL